jgi:hypothetical protein
VSPPNFHGIDTFTYQVNSNGVASAPAEVTINVRSVLDADIDIIPGSRRNRIPYWRKRALPVAILATPVGTEDHILDVRVLAPLSIRFGDPRLPGLVAPTRYKIIDVNGDGVLDLLLRFSRASILKSRALRARSTEVVLTGFTRAREGQEVPFEGKDSLQIVRAGARGRGWQRPTAVWRARAPRVQQLTQGDASARHVLSGVLG